MSCCCTSCYFRELHTIETKGASKGNFKDFSLTSALASFFPVGDTVRVGRL